MTWMEQLLKHIDWKRGHRVDWLFLNDWIKTKCKIRSYSLNLRKPIFSPLSTGKANPNILRMVIRSIGIIKLNMKNKCLRRNFKFIYNIEKDPCSNSKSLSWTTCEVSLRKNSKINFIIFIIYKKLSIFYQLYPIHHWLK